MTTIKGRRNEYGVPMEPDYTDDIVIEHDWDGTPISSDEDRDYYQLDDLYIISDDSELRYFIQNNMDMAIEAMHEYLEKYGKVTNTYEIMESKGASI